MFLDDEQRKLEVEPSRPEIPDEPETGTPPDYAVPERCNVLEQLRLSIVSPKHLVGLSMLRVGKFVRYVILLCFLVTMMTSIVPTAATIASFGGFGKLFRERMPEFTVQNGELHADGTFTLSLAGYQILMDTSENAVSQDKYQGSFMTIAIGKKRVQVAVSQNGLTEIAIDRAVSDFFEDGFNREKLISAIPGFYIGLGVTCLISMLWIAIKYLAASLIYMLLSSALARHTGLPLTRGNVFRLCFYAQTIGILLVNLNDALGVLLPSLIVSIVGIFISFRWIFKSFAPHLNLEQGGRMR